jgi:hypothetical protein
MDDELVTLWRYRDLPEALIAQGKLEASGVDCFLADDNIVRMDWFWSNLMGGVKLKVASHDREAALAVLSEAIPVGFSADEVGEEYLQPECPRCRSRDVCETTYKRLGVAVLGVLQVPMLLPFLSMAPLWIRKSWQCEECWHDWDAEGD